MRVHVLTPGFTTPNGCAFLFPLVVWRNRIREAGLDLRFFPAVTSAFCDADLLIVDSKFHKDRWANHRTEVLDEFSRWRESCPVLYFDTSDSSGWLLSDVLPVVGGYFKSQLLRDRSLYLKPLYGRRLHADYYHRREGAEDDSPDCGTPPDDAALLGKLQVSWNSGLADYSRFGPARMALYNRVPLKPLLSFPADFTPPRRPRAQATACRFGIGYARKSVAWQRIRMREILAHRLPTEKLSRGPYFEELRNSRLIVSPFGLGEITLKDFEVFLTGGLLLKPEMSHMETWPNFYRAGETMITHTWGLTDLCQVIDDALARYDELVGVAERGQEIYRQHTSAREAGAGFAQRLAGLLRPFASRNAGLA